MANSIYTLPSDDVAPTAAIAARSGSTIDTAYPAANLVNTNPAKPGKLVETSGGWVFDLGAETSIDLAALIHHNLTAGLSVHLQGHSTSDFTSPSLDLAFTIPAYREDGFCVNPFLDLSALAAHSYRYWSVVVLEANADPVAIGEVVLATSVRTFERNVAPGLDDDEDHPLVEHRTDHGVSTVYDLGTMWRTWSGTMPAVTDTGIAAYRSLTRAARGRARPFIFVPDPSVNDAWYVRLGDTSAALQRYKQNVSNVPVTFQEVSRGLPL